jgi:competence protein ComEA
MIPLVLVMKNKSFSSNRQIGLSVLIITLLFGHVIRFFYSSQGVLGTLKVENDFFIVINGEVINPGAYAFSKKPSLRHIIDKSGGLTAKLKGLKWDNNLPEIKRNSSLRIGIKNRCIFASNEPMQPEYKITLRIPISINTSTVKELDAIPYIGPRMAKKILSYRSLHGPFKSKEEIMKIKGIGRIRFSQLKSFIEI